MIRCSDETFIQREDDREAKKTNKLYIITTTLAHKMNQQKFLTHQAIEFQQAEVK